MCVGVCGCPTGVSLVKCVCVTVCVVRLARILWQEVVLGILILTLKAAYCLTPAWYSTGLIETHTEFQCQ